MLHVVFWVVTWRVVFNSRRFGTLCLFHLHRWVDMNCVKVESYVMEGGTDRPSPSCVGFAGSGWWWILMTGVLVWVTIQKITRNI
jgi:hypothetical protein